MMEWVIVIKPKAEDYFAASNRPPTTHPKQSNEPSSPPGHQTLQQILAARVGNLKIFEHSCIPGFAEQDSSIKPDCSAPSSWSQDPT
jgi:hypothetical protein